jgi:hypothetical protein
MLPHQRFCIVAEVTSFSRVDDDFHFCLHELNRPIDHNGSPVHLATFVSVIVAAR